MDLLFEQYPALSQVYFGNSLADYLTAAGLFIGLLVIFKIVQFIVLNRIKLLIRRTHTSIDDTLLKIFKSINPKFIIFLAFYLAVNLLSLSEYIQTALTALLIIWSVFQFISSVQILIEYITLKRLDVTDENDAKSAAQALSLIAKILLWSLGVLLILSNLGIDVTSLVAGFGIGGIAVAFAVQGILGDLFSSFTIYFDRPFRVGDFIVIGDKTGTVTKIGIKTTRIQSLQGEEIVIPNQKLTGDTLQNYKRMSTRRVAFEINVSYETSVKKLKEIPNFLKDIIDPKENAEFGRAHLKTSGPSSLIYEVVYVLDDSDYTLYMDTQQGILLEILEKFEKEKISIAYPSQTLYIKK